MTERCTLQPSTARAEDISCAQPQQLRTLMLSPNSQRRLTSHQLTRLRTAHIDWGPGASGAGCPVARRMLTIRTSETRASQCAQRRMPSRRRSAMYPFGQKEAGGANVDVSRLSLLPCTRIQPSALHAIPTFIDVHNIGAKVWRGTLACGNNYFPIAFDMKRPVIVPGSMVDKRH